MAKDAPAPELSREELHALLDQVEAGAAAKFPDRAERVDNLRAHLATCHMRVDDLHDLIDA